MSIIDPRPMCMGKLAYVSPQAAHAALAAMQPKIFRRKWGKRFVKIEPQEVYCCPVCSAYHLGRKP